MTKETVREVLGFLVPVCSIVNCLLAVYGVFHVVDFVVDVKPIVVPIANEVKEGKLDARELFTGAATMVRHDTVRVIERDTIYIGQNEAKQKESFASVSTSPTQQQTSMGARLTAEEEQRLDHSADNVSKQERQKMDNEETSFRERMRNKLNQH